MRFRLTLVGSAADSERDILVTAEAGSTFAGLNLVGTYYVDDLPIVPDAALGQPPLIDGARLSVQPVAPAPVLAGVRQLHVIAGPDAGGVFPLTTGEFRIGRAEAGATIDIAVADPELAREHARLVVTSSAVVLRDNGSSDFGTFLGAARVTGAIELPVDAPFRCGASLFVVATPTDSPAHTAPTGDGGMRLDRPPRLDPPCTPAVIRYPTPPSSEPPRPGRWLLPVLLPALAVAGMAWWSDLDARFLLLAVLSPVALLLAGAADWWRVAWRRRRERVSVVRATAECDVELARALRREQQSRRAELPDPAVGWLTATGPTTRLWQHHDPPDGVSLPMRIGLATRPARLTAERVDHQRHPALPLVPVVVDLAAARIVGVAGTDGRALVRWLVAQLALARGPGGLAFRLVATDPAPWAWLRWLSHPVEVTSDVTVDGSAGTGSCPVVTIVDAETEYAQRATAVAVAADGYVIQVAAEQRALTQQCAAVVTIEDGPHRPIARARLQESGRDPVGDIHAELVSTAWAERCSRALAPLRIVGSNPGMPAEVRLNDLVGTPDVDTIVARWQTASTTRVPLGADANGPVWIDLARDGPHALIAGTTGAGKSELLQTLLASLALHNPPNALSFVLIDYKGGAAFAECARLPHTVGLVTDLDSAAAARALASFRAELRRRESILAEAGVPSFTELVARYPGRFSRLVVVIDEFATLAADLPDLLTGLVDVARRGRSLGIHLVLATQRPAGVVSAEMRANLALRICLRVTDIADSHDVLDDPAAARLPARPPGRAVIRTAGALRPVQIARVSAPMRPAERCGYRSWTAFAPDATPSAGGETELAAVVAAVRDASQQLGVTPPPSPWLPPLPARLALDGLPAGVIGRVDEPTQQRQHDFALPSNHLLIVGPPGSGASSGLRTIAATIAQQPPDVRQLWVLDGGGELALLAELPHCRAYATSTDPDHLRVVLSTLDNELLSRRTESADVHMARLYIVVDSWELLQDCLGEAGVASVARLLRTGRNAHCTVVISGDTALLARGIGPLVGDRIVLGNAAPDAWLLAGVDRATTVQLTTTASGKPPGRGIYLRVGSSRSTEVQLALMGTDRATQDNGLRQLIARADRWKPVPQLRPLPTQIRRESISDAPGYWPLGVADDGTEVGFDLREADARVLLAGPPGSGRSSALLAAARAWARRGDPVLLIAPRPSPLREAAETLGGPGGHLGRNDGARAAEALAASTPDLLVVVDDCEALVDSEVDAALRAHLARGFPVLAAGSTDDLATSYRGFLADLRRARVGVLLNPRRPDGELFSVRVPATELPRPGRGYLVRSGRARPVQLYLPPA